MNQEPALVADPDRLRVLSDLAILDTVPEQGFEDTVRLASRLCAVPIALVSLVAADRQWFKARIGFPPCETDLDRSVCKFVLAEPDILVIPDLSADPRTARNPLVTGEPGIRFYAGAPLRTASGHVLGSLCVIDTTPRPGGLLPDQADDLRALARSVVDQIELRRTAAAERLSKAEAVADATRLEAMISTQQVVASSTVDLDTIFQAVVDGALRVVDAATGVVVELREGDDLVYRTAAGTSARHRGVRLPIERTFAGRALREETVLYCEDTETDPLADHELARGLGIRSMIVVPVFRHGVAIGVLKVQSGERDAFKPRDILMAQMLASLVASSFSEVAEVETRRALRDAESRYKAIFDSAVDFAIVAADPQARITDWNAGAERIMGWQATEVRGKLLDTFFTPEDQVAGVPQEEERLAREAGTADDERWHQRENGERFWAVGRMMTLRHEDDGVRGYLKILQDRTRERRREQRLDLIAKASEVLATGADPAGALLPVLLEGAEALGFDQSFVWDVDPDGRHLLLRHSIGVDPDAQEILRRVPFDVPLCGIVATTGRPLVLSGLQAGDEPRHAIARDAGIDAYASYPVTANGATVAVISFASSDEPRFDAEALTFFATVARFLSIARGRAEATRALEASEARSRLAQEAGRIGTFEIDLATDVLAVSDEMCRIFGLPAATSYPGSVFEACFDRSYVSEASTRDERQEGTFTPTVEYRIRRADDGRLRWIARSGEFVHDAGGRPVRMFGTVQDVTDRVRAETLGGALQELSDELRRLDRRDAIASAAARVVGTALGVVRAGYCTVDAARESVTVREDWHLPGADSIAGDHAFRTYGSYVEALKSGRIVAIRDVAGDPATAPGADALAAIGVRSLLNMPIMEGGELVELLFALDAAPRDWREDEVRFLRDVADRTRAAVARVEAEGDQRVLNEELSHRLKNTLAMVQSIATQTLRGVAERDAVEAFQQRLHALSSAHDVLLLQSWAAAPVAEIVQAVTKGSGHADRVELRGPPVDLGPRATLSLSLLVHELATNAAKYGALSVPAGRVDVSWRLEGADGDAEMVLDWRERDGPPPVEPATTGRKGFGSRLIRMGLVGTGGVELGYPSSGFEATMRAPLSQLQRS